MITDDLADILGNLKAGAVIMAIGNSLRMDDGVGPYIAEKLGCFGSHFKVIDAGGTPENFIDDIIALKPDEVLIIDAADFAGFAGEVRLIRTDDADAAETAAGSAMWSTHRIPAGFIAGVIASETKVGVMILGIQKKQCGFGERLSREVKAAADEIVNAICRNIPL